MKLGMEVGLGRGLIVLDGDPAAPPQKGYSPNFWPISIVLIRLDGSICQPIGRGGRPLPRRHCVRWGPSSPSPKGAQPPFSAHVCYGQTVGWIKVPIGGEVDLGR